MPKAICILLGFMLVVTGCLGTPGPNEPRIDTEVLVIGGGAAGMAAAIEAASLGVRVTLLEKTGALGGGALRSQGLSAGGTRLQDGYSADDFERDIREFGANRAIKGMSRLLASESASAIEFLEDLGLEFTLPDPEGTPWLHQVTQGNTGPEIVDALKARLDDLDVDVRFENRVNDLFLDDRGNMVGARVAQPGGQEFMVKAKTVILATGGFGSNSDMLARFADQWEGVRVNLTGPGSTGEGIRMSMTVGADVTHMQYVRVFPLVTAEGLALVGSVDAGGILVNVDGRRFADETLRDSHLSRHIMDQRTTRAYLVGDNKVLQRLRALLRSGDLIEEDSLEELARKMQVPPGGFLDTVHRYNHGIGQGQDEFGREQGEPLNEPPFFAQEVIPGVWATLGGLKVDEKARVLREAKPLPGFFAAGEVVGGIFGADERGGGHLTSAIVFGRIAARSAAEAVKAGGR